MRSIREKGKLLGEIYKDVVLLEKDPLCSRTNTFVRGSERYGAITQVDISLRPLPEEDTVETGESYLNKVRGRVRWSDPDGFPGKVVFEEWGKTPWLKYETSRRILKTEVQSKTS
jgi:hypothetical protein